MSPLTIKGSPSSIDLLEYPFPSLTVEYGEDLKSVGGALEGRLAEEVAVVEGQHRGVDDESLGTAVDHRACCQVCDLR